MFAFAMRQFYFLVIVLALVIIVNCHSFLPDINCDQSPCPFPSALTSRYESSSHREAEDFTSNDLNSIIDSIISNTDSSEKEKHKATESSDRYEHIPNYMVEFHARKIHRTSTGNFFDSVRSYKAVLGTFV